MDKKKTEKDVPRTQDTSSVQGTSFSVFFFPFLSFYRLLCPIFFQGLVWRLNPLLFEFVLVLILGPAFGKGHISSGLTAIPGKLRGSVRIAEDVLATGCSIWDHFDGLQGKGHPFKFRHRNFQTADGSLILVTEKISLFDKGWIPVTRNPDSMFWSFEVWMPKEMPGPWSMGCHDIALLFLDFGRPSHRMKCVKVFLSWSVNQTVKGWSQCVQFGGQVSIVRPFSLAYIVETINWKMRCMVVKNQEVRPFLCASRMANKVLLTGKVFA